MIMVTTENVPGQRVVKTLGLVRGNTIRARNIGQDIIAVLRMLVGGEVRTYTKLVSESREQALDRMAAEAERMGANAIVMLRFSSSEVKGGSAELLAYGTAVVLADES